MSPWPETDPVTGVVTGHEVLDAIKKLAEALGAQYGRNFEIDIKGGGRTVAIYRMGQAIVLPAVPPTFRVTR